jgi:hypothetical protein
MDNGPNHPQQEHQSSSQNSLTDSFKSAANSVALLYKEALTQNKKAFESGYQFCLQDLYQFVSSHQHQHESSPRGFISLQDLETFIQAKLLDLHNHRQQQSTQEHNWSPRNSYSGLEGLGGSGVLSSTPSELFSQPQASASLAIHGSHPSTVVHSTPTDILTSAGLKSESSYGVTGQLLSPPSTSHDLQPSSIHSYSQQQQQHPQQVFLATSQTPSEHEESLKRRFSPKDDTYAYLDSPTKKGRLRPN